MKLFHQWLEQRDPEAAEFVLGERKKHWIQDAVHPSHKGYCTPMSKPTCTGRRRALAKRFKHGDIHDDNED